MFRSRRSPNKGSPPASLPRRSHLVLNVAFPSLSRYEGNCSSRKIARDTHTTATAQGSTTAALTSHETIEFRNGPFPRRRFSSSPLPSYPAARPKREVTRGSLFRSRTHLLASLFPHGTQSGTHGQDTRYFSRRNEQCREIT